MKVPSLEEQIRRVERRKVIEWLHTHGGYIDEAELLEAGQSLASEGGSITQLIDWYVRTGGYIEPGRRYLAEKLATGIVALWVVAD